MRHRKHWSLVHLDLIFASTFPWNFQYYYIDVIRAFMSPSPTFQICVETSEDSFQVQEFISHALWCTFSRQDSIIDYIKPHSLVGISWISQKIFISTFLNVFSSLSYVEQNLSQNNRIYEEKGPHLSQWQWTIFSLIEFCKKKNAKSWGIRGNLKRIWHTDVLN